MAEDKQVFDKLLPEICIGACDSSTHGSGRSQNGNNQGQSEYGRNGQNANFTRNQNGSVVGYGNPNQISNDSVSSSNGESTSSNAGSTIDALKSTNFEDNKQEALIAALSNDSKFHRNSPNRFNDALQKFVKAPNKQRKIQTKHDFFPPELRGSYSEPSLETPIFDPSDMLLGGVGIGLRLGKNLVGNATRNMFVLESDNIIGRLMFGQSYEEVIEKPAIGITKLLVRDSIISLGRDAATNKIFENIEYQINEIRLSRGSDGQISIQK